MSSGARKRPKGLQSASKLSGEVYLHTPGIPMTAGGGGDTTARSNWVSASPVHIPNLARVKDFNVFLGQRYGRNTRLRIELFEKDYQPVLVTEVRLAQGGDMFSRGDVLTSKYQLKHDAFIGEVLYQIHGGTLALEQRLHNGDWSKLAK